MRSEPIVGEEDPQLRVSSWQIPPYPDLSRLGKLPRLLLKSVKAPTMAVFRRRWDVRIHHREFVPMSGPVILASNHIAVMDGPFIVGASPRHTYALAKQELFQGLHGRLMRWGGQIPVDRLGNDVGALRRCVQVLREGHALGIFPEGVRGRGDCAEIRPGVAYLAMVTGAPIIPVAMLGTRLAGASTRSVPPSGSRLDIIFGRAIEVPQRPWPRRRLDVATQAEIVRTQLAQHVRDSVTLTGQELPGTPPEWAVDAGNAFDAAGE